MKKREVYICISLSRKKSARRIKNNAKCRGKRSLYKILLFILFFLEKELQDFTHSLLLENDNSPFIIFIPEMNLF